MKKMILPLLLGTVLALSGCNYATKKFGGTMTIKLDEGQKLVEATWKDDSLWYLTKSMKKEDIAETYTFQEKSNAGIVEGKVIFVEKKKDE